MKKDFDTLEQVLNKAYIFDGMTTVVKEVRLDGLYPYGLELDWFKFDSKSRFNSYGLDINSGSEYPYTCLISCESLFGVN